MAVIPTCLYYLTLFLMVEIDVRKFGMKDVIFDKAESAWSLTKKYWFHFLSLVSIIGLRPRRLNRWPAPRTTRPIIQSARL